MSPIAKILLLISAMGSPRSVDCRHGAMLLAIGHTRS